MDDYIKLMLAKQTLEFFPETDLDQNNHPLGVIIFLQNSDEYFCEKVIFIDNRGKISQFDAKLPSRLRIREMSTALVFTSEVESEWLIVPFIFHKGAVYTDKFKIPPLVKNIDLIE